MIYGWIIAALTLALDLCTDTRPGVQVNHVRGALLRVIPLAVASWFISDVFGILAMLLGYWILFDGLWNLIKGLPWFRIGETAKLDQLQRKYQWIVPVKYTIMIVIAAIYVCK